MIDWDKLIAKARDAAGNAYADYSHFKVGAAILTADGKIFSGCNIENASYGLTICAERVAVFKAVSEGYKGISALAIYSESKIPVRPCGACLQVLSEFGKGIEILCFNSQGGKDKFKLNDLLPHGFTLER
jgi:cytidine deaminase